MYRNCSLILRFILFIRKATNKISRNNWKSKLVYECICTSYTNVCIHTHMHVCLVVCMHACMYTCIRSMHMNSHTECILEGFSICSHTVYVSVYLRSLYVSYPSTQVVCVYQTVCIYLSIGSHADYVSMYPLSLYVSYPSTQIVCVYLSIGSKTVYVSMYTCIYVHR